MTKRMLIDATHAEETRVVVLDGSRLENFDVETSTKRQLKGNIYLAKVVRVEPSLQAAFVEYGGGRHGFLAFGEIHPDYYQIPVADRQRLLALQAEEARAEEDEADAEAEQRPAAAERMAQPQAVHGDVIEDESGRTPPEAAPPADMQDAEDGSAITQLAPAAGAIPADPVPGHAAADDGAEPDAAEAPDAGILDAEARPAPIIGEPGGEESSGNRLTAEASTDEPVITEATTSEAISGEDEPGLGAAEPPAPESLGGESDSFDGNGAEEARQRRAARFLRNYRIQEVIRRRQIMLVQVVKEERGNKGAALTTYISLAGRFCVLMPNSPRGGGISRKITSAADRRRLKEITAELEIPAGMGLIVRTAGANRPKPEIRRDCEYLMQLWDDIRDRTMASIAPALIHEEESLIKRTIRDVYSRDIDEVVVDGEPGWRAAREFMRMLMPAHAGKVQLWQPREQGGLRLFARHQVDSQLDAMLSPNVQLKSGGYLVINQAEALVAIDVNSGRSTRERGIEETALRTNLEAADEVARQLRLRDLAGLIVIDFIDMDARKHNAMVEARLKDALRTDRARIQLGHISHFGLMEMSRQRLRPSLAETSFVTCPHCSGLGLVRSTESSAVHVLREIEEEGAKERAGLIMVHAAGSVVMYILNNKRDALAAIERRYAMQVHFTGDDGLIAPAIRIERLKPPLAGAERAALLAGGQLGAGQSAGSRAEHATAEAAGQLGEGDTEHAIEADDERDEDDPPASGTSAAEPAQDEARGNGASDDGASRRRRRRRRRGGRHDETGADRAADGLAADDDAAADTPDAEEADQNEGVGGITAANDTGDTASAEADGDAAAEDASTLPAPGDEDAPRARKRGRRGGRRRRHNGGEAAAGAEESGDEEHGAPGHGATEHGGDDRAAALIRRIPIQPATSYSGPTPANPFGTGAEFDIFDLMEQAEEDAAAPAARNTGADTPAPAEPDQAGHSTAPDQAESPPASVEPTEAMHGQDVRGQDVPAGDAAETAPAATAEAAASPDAVSAESAAPAEGAGTTKPRRTAPAGRARTTRAPSARAASPRAPSARTLAARAARAEAAAAKAEAEAADKAGSAPPASAPPPEASQPAATEAASTEAAASASTPAPVAEPAIKPLVVGEDVTPGSAPRRGWWRR